MNTKLIKFTVFLNLLLLACQFLMTSRRATDGANLARIDSQLSSVNQENLDLRNQIYKYSSLSYIYSQAQANQLIPVKVSFLTPLSMASTARP